MRRRLAALAVLALLGTACGSVPGARPDDRAVAIAAPAPQTQR